MDSSWRRRQSSREGSKAEEDETDEEEDRRSAPEDGGGGGGGLPIEEDSRRPNAAALEDAESRARPRPGWCWTAREGGVHSSAAWRLPLGPTTRASQGRAKGRGRLAPRDPISRREATLCACVYRTRVGWLAALVNHGDRHPTRPSTPSLPYLGGGGSSRRAGRAGASCPWGGARRMERTGSARRPQVTPRRLSGRVCPVLARAPRARVVAGVRGSPRLS